MTKRKFTVEQKLEIIQYADTHGIAETLRKYEISQSQYYQWKDKFHSGGTAALKPQYPTVDPEFKALKEENERLMKIVAKQALELEVKTELLKKIEELKKLKR